MLMLTRKVGEHIVINDEIRITIVALRGDRVRLGITVPRDARVDQWETDESPEPPTSGEEAV
jgi:carbon storage regulator